MFTLHVTARLCESDTIVTMQMDVFRNYIYISNLHILTIIICAKINDFKLPNFNIVLSSIDAALPVPYTCVLLYYACIIMCILDINDCIFIHIQILALDHFFIHCYCYHRCYVFMV